MPDPVIRNLLEHYYGTSAQQTTTALNHSASQVLKNQSFRSHSKEVIFLLTLL